MKKVIVLFLFISIHCTVRVFAQEPIDLPVALRVDTTNAEIKAVYDLWRSHLSNHPEKIYDNPFWSERQKRKWKDYDISRRWTYGYVLSNGMKLHDMFNMKPRVLSIVKEDSLYAIRTLYAPNNLEDWQEIYSIQRVYAGKEDGQWKLYSALPVLTRDWKRTKVGSLLYIYPPAHPFDYEKARNSADFVQSLRAKFNFSNPEPITYYLARDYDEMAKISGLDYAWDGNDGRGYLENRQVFVGTGSETYPHELVHVVFAEFDLHPLISEGLATLYGGIGQNSFKELIKAVAEDVSNDPSLTLAKAIDGRNISARNRYVGGAVLLNAAEERGGIEAIKAFLNLSASEKGIYEAIKEVLNVEKEQANQFWRNYIIELAARY